MGKGDYFGPLVVAEALVPADAVDSLQILGVRDSESLSDTTVRNLASQIRISLGRHRVEEITISPLKYNALYRKMRNVNRILGWAHARAVNPLVKWIMRAVAKPEEIRPGPVSSISASYTPEEIRSMLRDSSLSGSTVRGVIMGFVITGEMK